MTNVWLIGVSLMCRGLKDASKLYYLQFIKQEPAKRFRYNMKFRQRLRVNEWPHTTDDPLPARFDFGDPVVVYFGTTAIIKNCTIIKVHFTETKVSYDVEVKWRHIESADLYSAGVDKERELTSRLYNLDSEVVFSPLDFETQTP